MLANETKLHFIHILHFWLVNNNVLKGVDAIHSVWEEEEEEEEETKKKKKKEKKN